MKGRSDCALQHASYLSWKLSHCSGFHVPFLSAVMHWAARLLKHCRRAALCGGLSHRGVARTYVHAKKTYSMTLPQCWLSTNWRPCSSTHFCQINNYNVKRNLQFEIPLYCISLKVCYNKNCGKWLFIHLKSINCI